MLEYDIYERGRIPLSGGSGKFKGSFGVNWLKHFAIMAATTSTSTAPILMTIYFVAREWQH